MNMRSTTLHRNLEPTESADGFDPRAFLRPGLTEKDVVQLKEAFDTFDIDGDGFLSPMDIRAAMTSHGFKALKETVFNILAQYDEDQAGQLDFTNFVNMCSKNHNQRSENKNDIRLIFLKYDRAKRGFYDIDDLKKVARDLGEDVDDEVLQEMIASVDSNMDGRVTFEDFYNAMTKRIF